MGVHRSQTPEAARALATLVANESKVEKFQGRDAGGIRVTRAPSEKKGITKSYTASRNPAIVNFQFSINLFPHPHDRIQSCDARRRVSGQQTFGSFALQ